MSVDWSRLSHFDMSSCHQFWSRFLPKNNKHPKICETVIRKIFFLHYLQLRSTETFYEFPITKVHSFQKEPENLNFDSKSTSYRSETSEQMKNRCAFKLYPENVTRPNRTGPTKFSLRSLMMMLQG